QSIFPGLIWYRYQIAPPSLPAGQNDPQAPNGIKSTGPNESESATNCGRYPPAIIDNRLIVLRLRVIHLPPPLVPTNLGMSLPYRNQLDNVYQLCGVP